MEETGYLSAKEAAAALGISLPTLYSYVSRGLIRSEVDDPGKRTHRYRLADVEKLKQRKEQRRNPAKVVEDALHWGTPLLDSAITLIADNRLYYRGYDAVQLAAVHSVEAVTGLIWGGELAEAPAAPDPVLKSARLKTVWQQVAAEPPMERFQVLLPLAAAEDLAAYDFQPKAVQQTGARILQLLTAFATGRFSTGQSIARRLGEQWAPDDSEAVGAINMALVLCADHELNVSSFTARCVASAGATPYQVVMAGLAALQGLKHGRMTERVEAFLQEIDRPERVRPVIASRLKRGETLPGFGHQLYPAGDPRAKALLDLAASTWPQSPAVRLAQAVVQETAGLLGKQPTIDFGLVTVSNALNLPPGSAIALFALGRTIGWIGHALEAYSTDRIIRPRARYVGDPPKVLD